MAKSDWDKNFFHYSGGYLTYQARFVARFKILRGAMGDFKRFLVTNFTPDEYFGRLENKEDPLPILQSKGYVQPHIRKELKRLGYPVNLEGFRQMMRDSAAQRQVV